MMPLPTGFVDRLAQRFGTRLSTTEALRAQHAGGGMHLPALPPQAVLMSESLDDIVFAVRACADFTVPIIPFGVGTSLECHVGAPRGGLCIDLSTMNRVLRVSEADQDCTVEAGVTRIALNDHLRHTGLFFPVDPGADATLGGMASTRASGTTTLRYGGMRENVLGLTVVTPQGNIVRTARRARKSAAGYDLTHLYVGAEGTLGVIADVTLKLYPVSEAVSAAVCAFESTAGAVRSVIEAVQSGLPLARAEFLDDAAIRAVNTTFHTDYPCADTLFIEFHGAPDDVRKQAEQFGEVAQANGGGAFQWAIDPEARNQLWRARHQAGLAAVASRPGASLWSTDVCVPISRLAECVTETKAALARAPFPAVVLGHVGDGNFHCILLVDANQEHELAAARRFNDELIARAIAMDGTCTGEHGIGMGKRESLRAELGDAVDLMAKIKRALDPTDIMNPDKILDRSQLL
jgi:D-lactate dehydrogenase (cytochrome)